MYLYDASILSAKEFKNIITHHFDETNENSLDDYYNIMAKKVGFENFNALMNFGSVYVDAEDNLLDYMSYFKFPIVVHKNDGPLYAEIDISSDCVSISHSTTSCSDNYPLENFSGYYIEHDEWEKFESELEDDIKKFIATDEYKEASSNEQRDLIESIISQNWENVENNTFDDIYIDTVNAEDIKPQMTEGEYRKLVIKYCGSAPPYAAYDTLQLIHDIEII